MNRSHIKEGSFRFVKPVCKDPQEKVWTERLVHAFFAVSGNRKSEITYDF